MEEAALEQKVDDLKISPQYLMVVGDPGSLPFISTGLIQKFSSVKEYEISGITSYPWTTTTTVR